MNIDIPTSSGKVISLSLKRDAEYLRKIKKECVHNSVTVDIALANVTCDACKQSISPIWYFAKIIEHWSDFEAARKRYEETKTLYELKTRTKCDHCHKMTRIRPRPATESKP